MMFIAINRMTRTVYTFSSRKMATAFCLRQTARGDHPDFELHQTRGDGKCAKFIGSLWRALGRNFDEVNPWRMVD